MTIESQSLAVMFNKLPSLHTTPEFLALDADLQEYLKKDTVPHYETAFGGPKSPPTAIVPEGFEYLNIAIFAMNAQSSGSITLSTPTNLSIDLNLLTHPFDRRVLLDAVTATLEFFKKTKQYKDGFVRWLNGMDGTLEEILEQQVIAVWHANGTVKMGKVGEEGTCVDGGFRVVGAEGLRVVDMSVCPVTVK